jgi:hypothetical protein
MATRTAILDRSSSRTAYVAWTGLLNGDIGTPPALDGWDLVSWQVIGTFGTGGSVQMEASNEATPANYALVGAAATAAAVTFPADTIVARSMRPRVTAGDGTTSLTVTAAFRFPA